MATGHAHGIEAVLDQFTVIRNGATLFSDTFNDGSEPPSAPNFSTGAAASYSVFGSFPATAESGGVLSLNTANGAFTSNAVETPRSTIAALLLTGTGTGGTALTTADTLAITGTFALVTPTGPLFSGYGVQATDAAGAGQQQVAQMYVRYNESAGIPEIAYILQDFAANTITLLGSTPLAPPGGTDQIVLSITRPSTANSSFIGSYSYVDNGVAVGGSSFATPATLFQGESFVRGRFFAAQAVVPSNGSTGSRGTPPVPAPPSAVGAPAAPAVLTLPPVSPASPAAPLPAAPLLLASPPPVLRPPTLELE